jgi:N-acetylmuramoyl-L-alanine amidase
VIDRGAPFRGLTIAVDAGHPPGGAIGPTRLTEADANLMVTRHLVPMLEQAGARVVDIRPDTTTVPLIDRPIMAIENDSHLFVSVHFNAFPDGVNPFANHGTLMLYYWEHSLGSRGTCSARSCRSWGSRTAASASRTSPSPAPPGCPRCSPRACT